MTSASVLKPILHSQRVDTCEWIIPKYGGGGRVGVGEFKLFAKPELRTETLDENAIREMSQTLGDVNLITLQVCRASLLVASVVCILASFGQEVPNYLRLACAASGAACALSYWFYTRLIALRRLPECAGYHLEGNAVAEAMRVANWCVVVSLLTWSALLLRGPYEREDLRVGHLMLRLTYAQWKVAGPLFMGLAALLAIPIWHLVGLTHLAHATYVRKTVWVLMAFGLLSLAVVISSDVFLSIVNPSRQMRSVAEGGAARTDRELDFARFSCLLWFVYSLVAVTRTMTRLTGICQPTTQRHVLESATTTPYGMAVFACSAMRRMARGVYLVFFSVSTTPHNLRSMQQIASWVERGTVDTPSLTTYNLVTSPTDLVMNHTNVALHLHPAELSNVCTQVFDTILAALDVSTQAIVAFGYASLTVR